jgi:hypothetical protein
MTPKEQQIKEFNKHVESTIRRNGTCEMWVPGGPKAMRIAIFDADRYRDDYSIDGFVGWWHYDDSQMTWAATPYEVYCDMP